MECFKGYGCHSERPGTYPARQAGGTTMTSARNLRVQYSEAFCSTDLRSRMSMPEPSEIGSRDPDPGGKVPGKTGDRKASWAWRMGVLVAGMVAGLVLAWFLREGPDDPSASLNDQRPEHVRAAELDKTKQKAIWDAEHITFRIENRFGKPVLAAVVAGKPSVIGPFARPGFRGIVGSSEISVTRRQAGVLEEKTGHETTEGGGHDAEAFSQYLSQSLKRGGKIESTRFQLLQIKQQANPAHWWAAAFITIRGPGYIIESVHECDFLFSEETDFVDQPILDRWKVKEQSFRRTDRLIFEETTDIAGLAQLPLRDNWNLEASSSGQYQFQYAVTD